IGVLGRLFTENGKPLQHGYTGTTFHGNIASWPPRLVSWILKGLSFGLLGMLAYFCRTKAERPYDPRLLGEFSLVVFTMLFASERYWKHHYVTILLPYA